MAIAQLSRACLVRSSASAVTPRARLAVRTSMATPTPRRSARLGAGAVPTRPAVVTRAAAEASTAETKWIEPSLENNNVIRLLGISAALIAAAAVAPSKLQISAAVVSFTRIILFSTWFGTTIWTTFFAGILMYAI